MAVEMRAESRAMSAFRRVGLDSIAWSLRRLHCPVDPSALVLEVGSGGNPYYRANVLCDAYLETRERHFVPLIHDRPTVLAFVENLPFRDDAFDFVVASHVLEHSRDPELFLSEIQRVARAGYIEVPDAFLERLTCYLDHRLEITERDGTLVIRKKRGPVQDEEVSELFRHRAAAVFGKWVSQHPFHFHVRYYWSRDEPDRQLRYRVLDPERDTGWTAPESSPATNQRRSLTASAKAAGLAAARRLLSQNRRNRELDVMELLRCPACASGALAPEQSCIRCGQCGAGYRELDQGIIDFTQAGGACAS